MCGRYSLTNDLEAFIDGLGVVRNETTLTPRYNISPMQFSPVLLMEEGERILRTMRWGLVPSWAKDPDIGNRMINARAETLAEKPSFRDAFRKRRCCIVADGFYEWYQPPGEKTKTPIRFVMKDRRPFLLAGLWERWQPPGAEELRTFTIITAEPNELLARFHHRMAVILPADRIDQWLDPGNTSTEDLSALLRPYPADRMEAYPVSTRINVPRNDSPDLIDPQGDLFT
jgi:putative SOS response-associated peptidase YedK